MPFNLAVAQVAPEKGRTEANLDRISEACLQASAEGADLCVFPEAAVSGYILEGGVNEHALDAGWLLSALTKRLNGLQRPLDVLVGFYERSGSQPYNSAAYLELSGSGGRVVHVYRKFFLPTYGVFEEERFHQRGHALGVFETRLATVGVLICEDVWHSVLATLSAVRGAEILLVPSASPVRGFDQEKPGNVLRYERMLRSISEEHGMYTAAAMLVGFEGGKGFSGGSPVFDPFGQALVTGPVGEEGIALAEVDLEMVELARTRTPLLSDLRSVWTDVAKIVQE